MSKVAALQSKRLYPNEVEPQDAEIRRRFVTGFSGLLASPGILGASTSREFEFSDGSRYAALDLRKPQAERIELYEIENTIPIHYLLYNPLQIPSSRTLPVRYSESNLPPNAIGARVVKAIDIRRLTSRGVTIPTYRDVCSLSSAYRSPEFVGGWRLEDFVVDLLLGCREGYLVTFPLSDAVQILFGARSAPIAAAFSITISAPEIVNS